MAAPAPSSQLEDTTFGRGSPDHAVEQAQPRPANQQPTKNQNQIWRWDPASRDFVINKDDGSKEFYTVYQRQNDLKNNSDTRKPRGDAIARGKSPPPAKSARAVVPSRPQRSESETSESYVKVEIPPSDSDDDLSSSSSKDIGRIRPLRPKRPFEEPLHKLFKVVEKPKRFFSPGRIFKTPWFEPAGTDAPRQLSDHEWRDACPPFHSTKPIAKFRWFVVVRRRPSHTLCFSITTFSGPGTARERRDRPTDFVVLHKAEIPPPDSFEEEGITRSPLKVIIEEGEQYISPLARLDCGRVYTVEDNLRVLKIGRIHPESLTALEEYYRESALS
ncbi:hypothetical protein QBC39DRAFT_331780 [Podospora conica]|nr:hypothetical protein QBC39DRAFT_331780 [Schizothecium conicum]